ncbi:Two-component transcriptional response regulator, LuxR family [hydrothermal vent metagenome]|uniref:Two-component transcriptional response regulator, LuxR family n=1 Tax=hydrothermal vent metagenome TaxID=652676 RepID=A0A3B0RKZ8_9ZZZZ
MSETNPTISVLLVDDHPLVTEGIGACLETWDNITIAGTAATGAQAIAKALEVKPDIILMDINLPDMTGLEATRAIKKRLPNARIMILSMHDNREYVVSALEGGASGYILKDVSSAEVATAIEAVYRGGTYFSSEVSKALAGPANIASTDSVLTTREQQIIIELAHGNTNKMIARNLDISERTVETHRKNIKRKLKITSTAGLTRYAMENGLLT